MRQNPDASGSAPAAAPAKKPATFLSTLGRAAWNLPMDTAETLKGTMQQFGPEGLVAKTVADPVGMAHKAGDVVSNVAQILQGGAQRAGDALGTEVPQGGRADTSAYDKFADDLKAKYGSKQAIYKAVGDKPVGTALALASVVDPALRVTGAGDALGALGAKAAAAVGDAAAPALAKAANITSAERRATATAEGMRDDTRTALSDSQAASEADAAAAQDKATRVSALAARAQARSKALNSRSADAAAQSTLPTPDLGMPAHLSDIGDSIRAPAEAAQGEINTKMRAADTQYRSAMDAVAADRASSGVGVSDTDAAKELVANSKSLMSPDPLTRASVSSVPADSAGGKLHQMLLDVMQPKQVPLTKAEAWQAKQQNIPVSVSNGKFTRTIKPDLKSVDDFRRFLGKVLDGKVEGYEALNRVEAGQMYQGVSKAIDEYVDGASQPVQDSWKAGKQALEPFEKVRAGQAVVGTQKGTDIPSVPAANIPGRAISGGRDTLAQTAAVAGQAPVTAALRSQVQNAFQGVKGADATEALVRPGTKLGDAVATDDSLSAAVRDYIGQTRTAEDFGAQAKDLAARTATNSDRADRLSKIADTLNGTAAKATDAARGYQRDLANLEITDPKKVGAQYTSMLEDAHKAGRISIDQYTAGLGLAKSAEKDFALKATRDKWLQNAAYAAGLGALPLGAAGMTGAAAVAGAAGLGAIGMAARRKVLARGIRH